MRKIISLTLAACLVMVQFCTITSFAAEKTEVVLEEKAFCDFDDLALGAMATGSSLPGNVLHNKNGITEYTVIQREEGNNAISLTNGDDGQTPYFKMVDMMSDYAGVRVLYFDFMMPELYEQRISTKYMYKNTTPPVPNYAADGKWDAGTYIYIGGEGKIKTGSQTVYEGIEPNVWYNFYVVFDVPSGEHTFKIKKASESEYTVATVSVANDTYNTFSHLRTMEMNINAGKTMCFDNFGEKVIGFDYTITAKGVNASTHAANEQDLVDYENPCVKAEFSERLSRDTVTDANISVMQGDVKIPATVAIEDDLKTVYITPQAQLMPNTEYKVVSNTEVKTYEGVKKTANYEVTFKTMKAPYGINDGEVVGGTIPAAGGEFTYSVEVNNRLGETVDDILIVALYNSEDRLVSVNAATVNSTVDKTLYNVTLKAPANDGGLTVKVLLVDSFTNQKLIDKFVQE